MSNTPQQPKSADPSRKPSPWPRWTLVAVAALLIVALAVAVVMVARMLS